MQLIHFRSCPNKKTTIFNTQININQFHGSLKDESAIPDQVKQEIKVACIEFVVLDYRPFKTINDIDFKNLAQKFF
ncbi:unnamed protein product [Rotaria sordida]|uniref:Uncharacterized protein n=1 Tax=Rotaria sordida TaxID=392033 RepID=A0A813V7T8_9BILA|nr:unnamed protein product [Rotaria sordida]CAF3612144.1 unnamed protein product [Rotaria sordida]